MTFRGLPRVAELVPADGRGVGPEVTIQTESGQVRPPALRPTDGDGGTRALPDGRVLALDRAAATATFFGAALTPDLIAHPYLAPVATIFSRWAGREAFHAGAFVVAGRAWAVLGPRTAGKSTLLAAMADRGVPVLSDDIVVSDGEVAFRGPRCIDLREPLPAGRLLLRPSRLDSRWRVQLPGGQAQVPLGGWLFLHWGASLAACHVGPRELIGRLASRRAGPELPSDPAIMLALATLPAWDLNRPRDWADLQATVDLIAAMVEMA